MKRIKRILPLTVMSLAIVTLTAGALNTYAHFANKRGVDFDPAKAEEMRARHEAMRSAIENNDYQAWQTAVLQDDRLAGKFESNINEENFAVMVKVHQLIKDGKFEEARQLQEDSGFKIGMMGKGFRMMGVHD